ncbi:MULTISPECIES: glutathione peroxidase [Marinobacter]|jgi:glutathione peroxidase|uniref:Glutathione peroxidase n=1 Tax=Marinobacter nauticus TaxID=2743 RepID=A0A3D3WLU5_MARNT|nr:MULTISPECIES: glutathione peroxidase [Marinobacter]MEC8823090.1 glutathione peroxidase [Pseudomonadota bacterium]MAC24070.1 glutathione peroxidase [Marinobacter sp.]MAH31083.1 glutathione peroxidase [Marinobacter sp.]MAL34190.1 glutathione peroxidase [Marinobacter sp.]MAP32900.1 glutathione peroxidase [Marinobacter sp.]|tara:strand:+ start:267 stop:752 length:486 start_codon:yes stop_codon:yes gene_type:complete
MASETIYSFSAKDIKGQEVSMDDYRGKVLLIVNTASKCGFTPQFEGLQSLHDELGERGFEVLGFPCNQFMNQDPGNDDAISQFCSLNYGVSFPMFAKIEVNGDGTHPLFRFLKREAKGLMGSEKVKWNFTKFLVNRDGQVVRRYAPTAKPADIRADIEKLL